MPGGLNPRSANMRANRSKDTSPEMRVRRALYAKGLRYRLHDPRFKGKPDIILPSRQTAVFVHGCYWHSHGCKLSSVPSKRVDYWGPKLERNRVRDAEHERLLRGAGWNVIFVWECETRNTEKLEAAVGQIVDLPRRK